MTALATGPGGEPASAAGGQEPAAVRAFAPAIDRERAAAEVARASLWRPFARPAAHPARVELVHLPYRLVAATVRHRDVGRDVERELACLVCANTGLAFRFDAASRGLDRAPAAPLAARFDAAELDRRGLDYLRRWASSPRRPPATRLAAGIRAGDRGYPLWISIVQRRDGRLDVVAVDALTGVRAGSALRQALLLGLTGPDLRASTGAAARAPSIAPTRSG
jgi:hypothetical protein